MFVNTFIIKLTLVKKVLLFFIASLVLTTTFAQKISGSVKGKIVDSASNEPLINATILVTIEKDSSSQLSTLSSKEGDFEIKDLDSGEYLLIASHKGFETTKRRFFISSEKSVVDFGALKMEKAYKILAEVTVKTEAPVKISGDTVSYKADGFKTKPNATVEDLLKKLPGVQVDKDGKVKAQGEQVQKVYVDGKEFFNNDPKMATKNLTADMIDQVQVYNDASEEVKFNGIDDGSRAKAINLKLKKDKKAGIIGKAYGGYGTTDRYDAGLTANYFKGAAQTSLIAKANNINNMSYGSSDGYGAGANRGGSGGGLSNTSSLGLNYRDTWSESFDVNGSYFFNNASTANVTNSLRQRFLPDSTILTDNKAFSNYINDNHRLNFRAVYTPDSLNSIIYVPNINILNSRTNYNATSTDYVAKKESRYKANDNGTINNTDGQGSNFANSLMWRKKFYRQGRTLSVNISNTYNKDTRNGYSSINSNFYNSDGLIYRQRNTDNKIATTNQTNNYGINISYTEPLGIDKVVEVNYRYSNNQNNSDRKTYNYNQATKSYDELVDSLTNQFINKNKVNRIGTNFRQVKKKYNYQLGLAVQQTLLVSNDLSKNSQLRQSYINVFPSGSFNYQFAKSKSLRINYQGSTSQPNIYQLQNVTDITNYPYVRKGNPSLKPEFVNNIFLTYSSFNIVKSSSVFAFFTYRNAHNKITYSIEQRTGGEQVTMPVNLDGVFNLSGSVDYGMPIKKLKGSNFNMSTTIDYNRDVNLINNTKNFTNNLSFGEELRLSYNYNDNLDMGINASINYNSVSYTVHKERNDSYYTHNYSADVTYTFLEDFSLSTDIDYVGYTGRTDEFNQKYVRWNASLSTQLFKNKRGQIRLSVMDILNQNINISRNVADNYIEDVQNNTLKRFGLLTFTYNLNKVGGNKNFIKKN